MRKVLTRVGIFLVVGSSLVCGTKGQSQALEITEFMALNRETVVDEDGDRSDWIEVHNGGGEAVDLSGWYLTDEASDLTQWRFPAVNLEPDAYLLVFASGKDRRILGKPLHTNFQLSRSGEYLALVDPAANVVFEYQPAYPEQAADISYGLGTEPGIRTTLVPTGAIARALLPADDSLGLEWTEWDFDDSSWLSGNTGVGYDYGGLIGLDVHDMRGVQESVYIRIPFEISSPVEFDRLRLRIQYDDGMAAFLNGIRIASDNAPSTLRWNSGAPSNRPDSTAVQFAEFEVTGYLSQLRTGRNVLALQGLNNGTGSSDLLVRPELVGIDLPEGAPDTGYFFQPTPNYPNAPATPRLAGKVAFSQPGGTFEGSTVVSLLPPEDALDGSEIRYTTDGLTPGAGSELYQGPLTLTETTQIRARMVGPAGALGPIRSQTYLALNSNLAGFSSNLPVVVLENFGQGWMPQNDYQSAFLAIFTPASAGEGGRTTLVAAPSLTTRAGIKIRGSSTAGREKASLTVEAWNEEDEDRNIAPLGMPAESDWVLWGPYNFDRALLRNPLIFELSNRIGRYAVRTRFVEVFLNTEGGPLSQDQYWGVYALMEKIKRDDDRVDITKLFPDNDREPWVSGGYILKIDRPDPGDSGFSAAGQSIRYVEPKEVEIEEDARQAQEDFVRDYFNDFGASLNRLTFDDPAIGYRRYIDVDAAIDHHLLNVLAFNVDALRLSTYFCKDRDDKIAFGPIWDFDRAMGSTDGRDSNPWVWRSQSGDRGTDFFNYPWWGRMFEDIEFFQRYIDRWQELRRGAFRLENIHAVIDAMADQLREAQVRDLQRWRQWPRFDGYQGEINHIKDWFEDRIAFMDGQFVAPPVLDPAVLPIALEDSVTMSAPGGGVVYYTTDGTDPRRRGAEVSNSARLYSGPVSVSERTLVRARVFDAAHTSLTGPDNPPLTSHWSGPVTALISSLPAATAADLRITELHYNPADPTEAELAEVPGANNDDFEFVELKNIGASPIEMLGVRFTGGITFAFTDPSTPALSPGEHVVVVKSLEAFHARYGAAATVAGEYRGNLSNGGESLELLDAAGTPILSFTFDDDWFPLTDGEGFALVARDEFLPPEAYDSRDGWLAGSQVGGTPGADEPNPPAPMPIRVNEVRTHSVPPETDAIELFNTGNQPVNLGGWYLSDTIDTPKKFLIPEGTVVEPGEFLVFRENQFNTDPTGLKSFALDGQGESIFLFVADASGALTGAADGFEFGASAADETIGFHLTSTGEAHYVRQVTPTLGALNAGPQIGPVVIGEIMFEPPPLNQTNNLRDEFVELQNLGADPVPLWDPAHPTNSWQLDGGIEFDFPVETTLAPGEILVVVGFDPVADPVSLAAFQSAYGIPAGTRIIGPFDGRLNNGGERINLWQPDIPQEDGSVPRLLVDRVTYQASPPWPDNTAGTGNSLGRLPGPIYGDDPLHWQGVEPTPGAANPFSLEEDSDGDGLPDIWELVHGLDPDLATGDDGATGDPDKDGKTNEEEWISGTHPGDPASLLQITEAERSGGITEIRFLAAPGISYSILYRTRIAEGGWSKLQDIPAENNARVVIVTDDQPATERYYRLVAPSLP